jgi:hypothetical protein
MTTGMKFGKDHVGGALLLAVGAAAVVAGLGYQVGSLRQMGPGFFPVVLGALMALAGLAILATTPLAPGAGVPAAATVAPPQAHLAGPPFQPRAWACIIGGIVAFVVLAAHGGLVPASFVSVFVAALGDRRNGVRDAALLALAMTLFGVVVFHLGLHLLLPLFTIAG